MKKVFLLILIILGVHSVFAQNMNVQSASNSLKDNDLAQAKSYIDLAAANEQTANNYKMWYYRGKIYLAIISDTSKIVKDLDRDAAEKATISFLNCIKTDTRGWYTDECKNLVWIAGIGLYNSAIEAYNQNDFARAEKHYNLIFDVFPLDNNKELKQKNITPEIIYKNLYLNANKAGKMTEAKSYLQKLIDLNFNDPTIYLYMERILLQEKDTAQALSFLAKGRAKFEENSDLLNEELNIYIAQNKTDILLNKLTDAIALNPEQELLYFNRGTIFEKNKEYVKAEADYKKAVELKDDYFDAFYNLGAMVFNQGAEMANAANSITDDKKFTEAKAKADLKLRESLPFLERAYELNPKDKSTMQSLKQLYARINEPEKYNKIKTALDSQK